MRVEWLRVQLCPRHTLHENAVTLEFEVCTEDGKKHSRSEMVYRDDFSTFFDYMWDKVRAEFKERLRDKTE